MKLRQYQQEAVDEVLSSIAFGSNRLIVEAPTSYGKSIVISEIANQLDGDIVILLNISPLIDQISDTLTKIGVSHSVLKAGEDKRFNPDERIQIVMAQTLYARLDKINISADYILQDEIHKEYDTKRTTAIINKLKPKCIVGFTATPYDKDGFLLPDSELIRTKTVKELEDDGFLTPMDYYIPRFAETIDISSVKVKGQDYDQNQIEDLRGNEYDQGCIAALDELNCKSKKGIVFCSSIEDADKFASIMRTNDYSAYSYHSKSKEKDAVMESFQNNTPLVLKNPLAEKNTLFEKHESHIEQEPVKVLVAVDKLNIGFSVEDIEFGLSRRVSRIKSLITQMYGRVIRLHEPLKHKLNKYKDRIEYN